MRFKVANFLPLIVSAFLVAVMVPGSAQARTYIVNGIASAVPFIGYGMNNLGKRIPGSKVFSYITAIEGNRVIKPRILQDIEARYSKNPGEPINLIGISYGANLVSEIAGRLAKKGIPVNYLGIIEGTSLRAIPATVRKADNFICTSAECSKKRVRLAGGNNSTSLGQFTYDDGHIDLGNNKKVHSRIISRIR
ncbi:MAG: hypothetical protein QNJ29_10605 [Rhizobiaceae bacterium]|nr:hypothetical protein [Rhizobiaceae bacterium]